jgi:hypothetical protein
MKNDKEMKSSRILAVSVVLLVALTGCKSRVIRVSVVNASQQPLSAIIVDYPSATFGVNMLAPGQTWQYTIKPVETGPLKVQYTNAQGQSRTFVGPTLSKNNEGVIQVSLQQDAATSQVTIR